VVRLDDKVYGDGRVPGAEKAKLAKKQLSSLLGIDFDNPSDVKLMEVLGQRGIMLELLDAEEYELVVPHRLFSSENFILETIAEFKRHATKRYLTTSYRRTDRLQRKRTV